MPSPSLVLQQFHTDAPEQVAVSSKGYVASSARDGTRIWSIGGRGLVRHLDGVRGKLTWSPDGERVFILPEIFGGKRPLMSWRVGDAEPSEIHLSPDLLRDALRLSAVPGDTRLPYLLVSRKVSVNLENPENSKSGVSLTRWDDRLERSEPHWFSGSEFADDCEHIDTSADGSIVGCSQNQADPNIFSLVGDDKKTIVRVFRRNARGEPERIIERSLQGGMHDVRISPDGSWALFAGWQSDLDRGILFRVKVDTRDAKLLRFPEGLKSPPDISSDSRLVAVAFVREGASVWEISSMRRLWSTTTPTVVLDSGAAMSQDVLLSAKSSAAFSPDGRSVFVAGFRGVSVHRALTGRLVQEFGAPIDMGNAVSFSDEDTLNVLSENVESFPIAHALSWSLARAELVSSHPVNLVGTSGAALTALAGGTGMTLWGYAEGRERCDEGKGIVSRMLDLGIAHVDPPFADQLPRCLGRYEEVHAVAPALGLAVGSRWVGRERERSPGDLAFEKSKTTGLGLHLPAWRRQGENLPVIPVALMDPEVGGLNSRPSGGNAASPAARVIVPELRVDLINLVNGTRVMLEPSGRDEKGSFFETSHDIWGDTFIFSPSGRWVASREGLVWDVADGRFSGHLAVIPEKEKGRPFHRAVPTNVRGARKIRGAWEIDASLRVEGQGGRIGAADGVVFSLDDRMAAAIASGVVTVYELPSFKKLSQGSIEDVGAPKDPTDRARIFAFVPGSSALIVKDSVGRICLYRDGKIVARSDRLSYAINGVAVSPQGRAISVIGSDGIVHMFDGATLAGRVSLVSFSDGEHIAFTPAGAYKGTREVATRVGWVFGNKELFSFDQFARTYEQPDLVRRRASGDSTDDLEGRPPQPPVVSILSAPSTAPAGGVGRVRARASSPRRVHYVQAFVEGRPVSKPQSLCIAEGDVEIDVPIGPGVNRVSVIAFDEEGYASNAAAIDVEGIGQSGKPRLWVVSVGVNKYPNLPTRMELHLAGADAEAVAERFAREAEPSGMFREPDVTKLIDAQATPAAIREGIERLARMAPEDVAVVFLAGHGMKTGAGDMRFATSLLQGVMAGGKLRLKPESVETHTVGWREIGEGLRRARGRVVVLLDACHSGAISQEALVPNGALASFLVAEQRAGAIVFAAAKGWQESYEPTARGLKLVPKEPVLVTSERAKHGLFTAALLRSLDDPSTDRDDDGVVQLSELIDTVTKRVHGDSNGLQTPWVSRREVFGDFGISRARRGGGSPP